MPDNRFTVHDGIISWFNGPEWDDVVLEAFRSEAQGVEAEARQNAPWADRTGMARSGLEATVKNDNGEIIMMLAHTAEHGLWLEVIQAGRFAIIMPTLEAAAPRVFARAAQAVENARRGSA